MSHYAVRATLYVWALSKQVGQFQGLHASCCMHAVRVHYRIILLIILCNVFLLGKICIIRNSLIHLCAS